MSNGSILTFDIGRSNWKAFIFNERYETIFEKSQEVIETVDEDGYPCENLSELSAWVLRTLDELIDKQDFHISAVNFSAHGAAFVNVDEHGQPVTPLYNYLKPFPADLQSQFYRTYGGEKEFSRKTASPVLGHLNVGMQLYWLKHHHPDRFSRIRYSLFLPQYLSLLLGGRPCTDMTSIGCHTNLWDFTTGTYHDWVRKEQVTDKLAPVLPGNYVNTITRNGHTFLCGIGLHDSSAAMIPYLKLNTEPFAVLSTGTWSITMNPFNGSPLTDEELKQDCLCYIRYDGQPLKASRLLAGPDHQEKVSKIAEHFYADPHFFQQLSFRPDWVPSIPPEVFDPASYPSAAEAYHAMMSGMVAHQKRSSQLVITNNNVKQIFVDGGFSRNEIFMELLSRAFPQQKIKSSHIAQAGAWGAAMVLHEHWNAIPLRAAVSL